MGLNITSDTVVETKMSTAEIRIELLKIANDVMKSRHKDSWPGYTTTDVLDQAEQLKNFVDKP
jgi:hypothetical protein